MIWRRRSSGFWRTAKRGRRGGAGGGRRSSRNSRSIGSRTESRTCTDPSRSARLRHDPERHTLSFVRPGGPRSVVVWRADDEMDAAELVEEGEVLVRRLAPPAGMGMDCADDREIRRERVELKDRVVLSADGARNQDELRDDALLGAPDCPN